MERTTRKQLMKGVFRRQIQKAMLVWYLLEGN